jgi:MFS family permease
MAQGWVVTRLTSAAWVLGALNVANTLPMLALSMVGGAFADRMEKRRILIVTQVMMMFLAFVLAGLVFGGKIALWQIFAVTLVLGTVTAFDLPAAQAFPPELVQKEEIPKTIALMQAIFHGSRLVGPGIAGFLVAQFGEGSAFMANGLSFVAVIVTLLLIPDRRRHPSAESARKRGGMGDGFRFVKRDPMVGPLMMLTALTTTFVFPFIAVLMVYFVRHVLQTDAKGMGTLMSASGLGSLTGAVVLLFGNLHTLRRWLATGIIGCGLMMLGLSFVHDLWHAVPLVAVLSFSVSSLMGRISQTIQHVVPNELRGRVMGVFGMAFAGLMPYAALLLAGLADLITFQWMLRVCVALYLVLAIGMLLRVPSFPAAMAEPVPEPAAVA